jgi:hypothetical protein
MSELTPPIDLPAGRPFIEPGTGRQTGVVVDAVHEGQARLRHLGDDRYELLVLPAPFCFPAGVELTSDHVRALLTVVDPRRPLPPAAPVAGHAGPTLGPRQERGRSAGDGSR